MTFRSLTLVAAELRTVHILIDADARLAAAAGGAARYFADAAGLSHDAVFHLQTAVVLACESAFGDLSKEQAVLDVTLTWLVDRIEVAVSHKHNTRAGQYRANAQPQALDGVDDVQQELRDGVVVMRLTKFIKQGAASR